MRNEMEHWPSVRGPLHALETAVGDAKPSAVMVTNAPTRKIATAVRPQ